MYVHHMRAWYPQKPEETSDPLELELQAVVSRHVGAGH